MKIAVLAEQNFNLIDGSTIWLLNLCKLLDMQDDLQITLLLSHRLSNRVLAQELPARIRVVDAAAIQLISPLDGEDLTAATLVDVLTDWEQAEGRFDRIFVRGTAYLTALLAAPTLCARIIGYAPSALPDLAEPEPEWLTKARALRAPIVVQSEVAKRALESLCDYPSHVVHVVPPIVFETGAGTPAASGGAARTTLCYSGKIDPDYGLDWLLTLCRALQDQPTFAVSLVAGKDTYRSRHAAFFTQMDAFRTAVAQGGFPGVSLVTALPHAQARALMAQADFAYCLRHAKYDDVLEISTKVVEFCAAGVPPILNDTALNRSLFGADYPYLIDIATQDVQACLQSILKGKGSSAYATARQCCAKVASAFSAQTLSAALGRAIRGYASGCVALTNRPRKVLIATHDAKFLNQFLDRAAGDAAIQIGFQPWTSTTKPAAPPTIPDDVDTVFCEWCCENAVWHSHNKRAHSKLIVRLHRFEAFREFPERVNWAAVDALIVVSDHFRDIMVGTHGVDPARIHVLPQYIDWHGLQRPKTAEARFTIGLVGINPFEHKRFDRALDFVAALRARDPRFSLAVRSVMPWQIDWVWENRPDARALFVQQFRRIYSDPLLVGAVRFDPAGPDMEEWYRGVGTILSSSDSEGCHTSVIEGMASGACPVVYDWPGARSLFSPCVYAQMTDAIPDVIGFADNTDLDSARQSFALLAQRHDVEHFAHAFFAL